MAHNDFLIKRDKTKRRSINNLSPVAAATLTAVVTFVATVGWMGVDTHYNYTHNTQVQQLVADEEKYHRTTVHATLHSDVAHVTRDTAYGLGVGLCHGRLQADVESGNADATLVDRYCELVAEKLADGAENYTFEGLIDKASTEDYTALGAQARNELGL